jgi:hypothetical protein
MRFLNPTLRLLLRAPVLGSLGKDFMVLSFTGRKSGRRYSVPVSAHEIDGALYALADAPWKANFRDGAAAEVLHNGKNLAMRGELIRNPSVVADLYDRLAASYGVKKSERSFGLKFRGGRLPTLQEFTEAVEQNGLAAVRLTPAG